MRRPVLLLLAAVAAVVLGGQPAAATTSPTSGTLSSSSSVVVWSGGPASDEWTSDELFYLTVEPVEGRQVQVTMLSPPTGDWDIRVYAPDGDLVVASHARGDGMPDTVTFAVEETTTFYVWAWVHEISWTEFHPIVRLPTKIPPAGYAAAATFVDR